MKKFGIALWAAYTLLFVILYAASFDSFMTALEEANFGNFMLMMLIFGAIVLAHYFTMLVFNSRVLKREVIFFTVADKIREGGALYIAGAAVLCVILSPIAGLFTIAAHAWCTWACLFDKTSKVPPLKKPYNSAAASTQKPNPAPAPAPKPTPAPSAKPAAQSAPVKSNYSFDGYSYDMKCGLGGGHRLIGYCGSHYFGNVSMKTFNVNIYDGRTVVVYVSCALNVTPDESSLQRALENGETEEMIERQYDRDRQALLDATKKRILEEIIHITKIYKKENGPIPKEINTNIEVEIL